MEFVKQLVAFGLLCGAGNRILLKNKEDIEDAWIHSSNSMTETELLEPMSEENRQFYQEWINKEQGPPPAAPPETAPETETELGIKVVSCANCGAEVENDPLTGLPFDQCPSCGKSSSVKEEPEPKSKKRRSTSGKDDKTE